ncbi:hypothetical protein [Kordiimonas pumila]|uniref:Uncharacterized protein n=1 Tax=Kordiimonas pumila TaxID=2161677 RepID=A0ABV7D4E1_9PROT|nr:hypothetical protein [Kordiimonas pumila]
MQHTVTILSRFNGPPKSANGGYACGLMAKKLAGIGDGPVEAALSAPPPLDAELLLEWTADTASLLAGGKSIGRASRTALSLDVPALPTPLVLGINPVDAPDAPGKFVPFETCFVCGQRRTLGDGLCIHSKEVEGHPGLVASDWVLDSGLASADGNVDLLYIWSALDCPGYFACAAGEAALLGRLSAEIIAPLKADGTATVIGWNLTKKPDSRKRQCGTAIFDEEGTLVAKAEGLWITIDPANLPD